MSQNNQKELDLELQELRKQILNSDLVEADKRYCLHFIEGKTVIEVAKELTAGIFMILEFLENLLKPIAEKYPNSIFAEKYKIVYDFQQKTSQEFLQNSIFNSLRSNFNSNFK